VVVGDRPLDERAEAVLGAGREAMLNAAKHAPDSGPVRAYAEITPERIDLFVHDRGPGFDPAHVAGDRRGVSESIVGRMQRAGGTATIRSEPGGGTEVELALSFPAAEEAHTDER
jgi:signal transduction histidine kinase